MKTWVLLLGSILAIALVGLCCCLVWLNRESDKSWSLLFKMIGPLGLAAFLLVHELLSPLEDDITDIPVMIIFDQQLDLARLERPLSKVDSEHLEYFRYLLFANPYGASVIKIPDDPNQAFEARGQYALDLLYKNSKNRDSDRLNEFIRMPNNSLQRTARNRVRRR